ncbi:hypothetical protein [Methanimicrococcus blatticola]|uniref:hypothetical protein n=1 Tax=Methanimicrococcus blatticola TaxID=91560 RepID=UPI001061FC59|nr:hypothetical protein [Methanimicrococcus blatticola]MBZ3936091.1 hypothetical protein [Methanimicrococcus blatticola]MCC2509301.1 hypothetical protein [Methanimicrococcus blatticola]
MEEVDPFFLITKTGVDRAARQLANGKAAAVPFASVNGCDKNMQIRSVTRSGSKKGTQRTAV